MSDLPETVVAQILEGDHPIAAVRIWRGIGTFDLAQAASVDTALIEDIEAGMVVPSEGVLAAIAAALDVEPADLLNHQDDSDEIGHAGDQEIVEDDIPW